MIISKIKYFREDKEIQFIKTTKGIEMNITLDKESIKSKEAPGDEKTIFHKDEIIPGIKTSDFIINILGAFFIGVGIEATKQIEDKKQKKETKK